MHTYTAADRKQADAPPLSLFCICCGELIDGDDANCSACYAPRELSDDQGDGQAKFISVLGASGSGKTVYLSILIDILSNGDSGLQAMPKHSFSVASQTRTLAAVQDRCFPEKTPSESDRWNWVQCELRNDKHPKQLVHLITPDLAGEAIAMEFERPGSSPAIREVVRRSQAVIMLIDAMAVCENNTSQDHFALQTASYLYAIKEQQADNCPRELDIPIAVVFTKCDECQDVLGAPEDFARNNVPRLVASFEHTFPNQQFFAACVAGSLATIVDSHGRQMRVPLHTEPRGVVWPIEWIMNQKVMR
jgi:hypothetical protein